MDREVAFSYRKPTILHAVGIFFEDIEPVKCEPWIEISETLTCDITEKSLRQMVFQPGEELIDVLLPSYPQPPKILKVITQLGHIELSGAEARKADTVETGYKTIRTTVNAMPRYPQERLTVAIVGLHSKVGHRGVIVMPDKGINVRPNAMRVHAEVIIDHSSITVERKTGIGIPHLLVASAESQ